MTAAVGAEAKRVELTFRGILLGILICLVFTAANVYLGLKVGLTVATSIPAARRSWTRRNAVVVLPAVPVTPIVGTRARSSTRSPRQRTRVPAARSRETRGATSGVQTSRNA